MRTFDRLIFAIAVAAGFAAMPAFAFDGNTPSVGPVARTPVEAFRYGAAALKTDKAKAVSSLEYAAENGHPMAQWKLGRMYAEGDGVPQDDLRAFEYFSRIANAHADDSPGTPQARFVANAFVALGHYYLEGIPKTKVKPDAARARQMFTYAATYFGDPEAQFNLARLYIDGNGTQKDTRQAARWLYAAAQKGQFQAQAQLGAMLFSGDGVPRQSARGLMWLTLAKDAAPPDQVWVNKLYDSAFTQATDDERSMALVFLERWLKTRRE